ncbi:MAG TPA: PqqD family peptide modification chaperone [Acidimicrobiales bacterium]|nr:PqqD family peptide modification chaperone [Acidimicrobiales bacterium]
MTFRTAPDDEVLYHEEAGEAFLLHVPSGEYFGLNPPGVVVWKAVRDGLDPVEELARRWPGVATDSLKDDAVRLLGMLRDAGLVIESDDTPGGT